MSTGSVEFYRLDSSSCHDARAKLVDLRAQQPDYGVDFWRPGVTNPFPPGAFDPRLASYTLMHLAGAFQSPDYGAVVIKGPTQQVEHRSMIMPRFARFPFMGRKDIQIGATFTHEEARGRGLALRGLLEIVDRHAQPGRDFWYLTEAVNAPSVAVIRKAGFVLEGEGVKHPRFGLRLFGFYEIGANRTAPPRGE